MQENRLIRKLGLISKFMTPQIGQQIITIHILSNISRNEGNGIDQLIEYNVRSVFFKNHAENEVGRLVQTSFCFF